MTPPSSAAASPAAASGGSVPQDADARAAGRGPAADPLPDVPRERRPRHVAVIMDGNGRWAAARGLPRLAGHREGARSVRAVVEAAVQTGVEVLTLYSFSSENWKRPPHEVEGLMLLYREYLVRERAELLRRGIRFRQIGRRDRLPRDVIEEAERTEAATAQAAAGDDARGLTLVVALDYGARAEIAEACRGIARDAAAGRIDPDAVDEDLVGARLDTAGLPDPDLLIRSAGEYRLSNYLLWQCSYAEIHVADECWPDFREAQFHRAIRDFAGRERRFGGLRGPASGDDGPDPSA